MALVPTLQLYRFTVEEYLAFERASDERHEYLDGLIYAMAGESPNHGRLCTNLGGLLYAHLRLNVPDYYANQTQRDLVVELADYLARKLEIHRPDEASAARVLRELVKNQRLG